MGNVDMVSKTESEREVKHWKNDSDT